MKKPYMKAINMEIIVKQVPIEEALKINQKIVEFNKRNSEKKNFSRKGSKEKKAW